MAIEDQEHRAAAAEAAARGTKVVDISKPVPSLPQALPELYTIFDRRQKGIIVGIASTAGMNICPSLKHLDTA
jgi:hypothetical protein